MEVLKKYTFYCFYTFCIAQFLFQNVRSVAVMSVDLGSESMKVAIVSPGMPMEIALNTESKRKTPVAIAFRDNERLFGEDALSFGVRFPSNCYKYFTDLLGKQIDNPIVQLFKERFPYYNLINDPIRNTVLFKHNNDTYYSPEELVGMMLYKAKQFAEESAGQTINEAVLTVPGYFNQIERKSMLKAAELANLKVLQLMNDYTAAALSYGIFRTKDFNETEQYIMLYDIGAYSTSASIIGFQVVKNKEKGVVETNHQLSVLGVGFDRTLGGLEMQMRLTEHLAKKFNDMKKTTKDVFKNPRSMAKLFKEAGRVKNVLSANLDHYAQIEGLIDEIDFKVQVSREEFEALCADLIARVKNPVEQAIKHSGLSIDVISQLILVGAGTRVPAIQNELKSIVKNELGKNLNTDEAIVLGAAYKAADLGKGFKVKKFITKDAVLFPLQVHFEKEGDKEKKLIKRTLFGLMNPYPQKKLLTFNKHQRDFSFVVQYGELETWPEHEISFIGSPLLNNITLSGVVDAIKKHEGKNSEPKGIKVHFSLDESGILSLTGAEYVVEKMLSPEELNGEFGQSAFSKISNTISKLFQATEENLKPNESIKPVHEEPVEDGPEIVNKSTTSGEKVETPNSNTTDSSDGQDKTDKEENKSNEKAPTDKTADDASGKEPVTVTNKEATKTVVKEDIAVIEKHISVPLISDEQFNEFYKKIMALNEFDFNKRRYDSALNALESAIIDSRLKLDNELQPFVTKEEQNSISKKCDELSEWLEEESYAADADILESKLKELKSISSAAENRFQEHQERPDLLSKLETALNYSTKLLGDIKKLQDSMNKTETGDPVDPQVFPYTATEIETLEKVINSTGIWKDNVIKEQEVLLASDDPILTTVAIREKIIEVDREVRYLINKSRMWKPPKKDEKKTEKPKAANATKTENAEEDSKTDEIKVPEEQLEQDVPSSADGDVPPVKEKKDSDSDETETEGTHTEL